MDRNTRTVEDPLRLLDGLFAPDDRWDTFYADLYRRSTLDGGLAYSPESLRWVFSHLTEVDMRRMRDEPPGSPRFGEPFLWTALFRAPLRDDHSVL